MFTIVDTPINNSEHDYYFIHSFYYYEHSRVHELCSYTIQTLCLVDWSIGLVHIKKSF